MALKVKAVDLDFAELQAEEHRPRRSLQIGIISLKSHGIALSLHRD